LTFSEPEFIDISDEIELLRIYLELEKLRFSDDFECKILEQNIEDVQVPPMLVQPYVENAIKHGLLHKTGRKILTIRFELTDNLYCIVTDNGIGRARAAEIKARQRKSHTSFATNATQKRIEIMQHHYKQTVGVQYIDLYENEKAVGTEVRITMPFRKKY